MEELEKDIFLLERIASNRINWRTGQKEKIVELYNQGTSIKKIGRLFGGLHYNTIKKILQENGIQLRTRSQSHFLDNRDDNIFSNIDSHEKAYWLGFLAADGCVSGNYIIIILKASDKPHLEKFRDFIGASSVQISEYYKSVNFDGTPTDKPRKYARLSIGCKQIADDLKQHGIVENKTLILKPPKISKEFYFDWIRGYFDGDGCISYNAKSNRWQSNVVSTKEVCIWIVEQLGLNTKPYTEEKYHGNNIYVVRFNGRLNVLRAFDKMYYNDTATIYLDRKYELYKQLRCSS